MSCSDIFLGLIAILFPPIAVWIKSGLCSADSCINILLCMLGYFPGLIHAWYIIAKSPEHDYDRIDDPERQDRVTYYYISHEPAGRRQNRNQRVQGYGTVHVAPANKPSSHHCHHHYQQPQYQSPQQPQQSGVVRSSNSNASVQASSSTRTGSNDTSAPPPYSEVVRGDHKIQTRD